MRQHFAREPARFAVVRRGGVTPKAPGSDVVIPAELDLQEVRVWILRKAFPPDFSSAVILRLVHGGHEDIVAAQVIVVFSEARRVLTPGLSILCLLDLAG